MSLGSQRSLTWFAIVQLNRTRTLIYETEL